MIRIRIWCQRRHSVGCQKNRITHRARLLSHNRSVNRDSGNWVRDLDCLLCNHFYQPHILFSIRKYQLKGKVGRRNSKEREKEKKRERKKKNHTSQGLSSRIAQKLAGIDTAKLGSVSTQIPVGTNQVLTITISSVLMNSLKIWGRLTTADEVAGVRALRACRSQGGDGGEKCET